MDQNYQHLEKNGQNFEKMAKIMKKIDFKLSRIDRLFSATCYPDNCP